MNVDAAAVARLPAAASTPTSPSPGKGTAMSMTSVYVHADTGDREAPSDGSPRARELERAVTRDGAKWERLEEDFDSTAPPPPADELEAPADEAPVAPADPPADEPKPTLRPPRGPRAAAPEKD